MGAAEALVVEEVVAREAAKHVVRLTVIEGGLSAAGGGAVATGGSAAAGGGAAAAGGGGAAAVGGMSAAAVAATAVVVILAVVGIGYLLYRNFREEDQEQLPEGPFINPSPIGICPIIRAGPERSDSDKEETKTAPDPEPLKYPNQTCSNETLDKLQKEKDALANEMKKHTLDTGNPKKDAKLPCSYVKQRVEQYKKLIEKRWEIQNTCFGGKPDKAHEDAIAQAENGLKRYNSLVKTNCAPGHAMADQ